MEAVRQIFYIETTRRKLLDTISCLSHVQGDSRFDYVMEQLELVNTCLGNWSGDVLFEFMNGRLEDLSNGSSLTKTSHGKWVADIFDDGNWRTCTDKRGNSICDNVEQALALLEKRSGEL